MSEQTEDYDSDEDEQQTEPGWRKKLEREAKQGREAVQAAQDAKKELAFYKAGIPMTDPHMTDPRMAYFVKGYDGEFSAEAIRKAATDAGFIEAAPQDTAVADEVTAQAHVAGASQGATVAGKLTHADILNLARKAADAAPVHLAAQTYANVLSEHGLSKVQQAPAQ